MEKTPPKKQTGNLKQRAGGLVGAIHEMLTGEDDGRVCRDIPEAACREQPGNFLKHVIALAATKAGDRLADPKLVLAWLLGSLGAPAFLIGWLVPVREAGALLPQLVIAARIRSLPKRKWIWVGGSLIQGIAVLGMAVVALVWEGAVAGWMIVGLLSGFALARSACSVSYKDVLGKTVSKSTRGTATGTASTLAAAAVLLFGILLSVGILPRTVGVIIAMLSVAGGLWIMAAMIFATVREFPGATEGGGNPLTVAARQLGLLKDAQFTRFIATRSLLVATALAPPYVLLLVGEGRETGLGSLGLFVFASALAGLLSSYVWGRLSDSSSRRVLVSAALVSAAALGMAALIGGVIKPEHPVLPLAGTLFVLMVAHQGVRLGRSTHLVDMASAERRAAYTALSNSLVGLVLVLGGGFGFIVQVAGVPALLVVFSLMCVGAAILAHGLDEVQQ